MGGDKHVTYVLTVPIRKPPMTLNEQRRAHWQTVRKAKTEAEQHVWVVAKAARIPRIERAHVEVIWFAPDKRARDADALAPFLKACLDTLVKIQVLRDDSFRYVPRVSMGIEIDRARPRIEVRIAELSD